MASIWWIRRDLRLSDNLALKAAMAAGEKVIPLFILDPALLSSPMTGDKRVAFLLGGLRELDRNLRARGSTLVIRRGNPAEALKVVAAETGASSIYAEADHSPYAQRRDHRVRLQLPLILTGGLTVYPPEAVLKSDGTPYTIFTPFSRRWKELPSPGPDSLLPPPERIATPNDIPSLPIPADPSLPDSVPFRPGEKEAHKRLVAFTSQNEGPIFRYADHRNRMDLDGTSGLSPYLRFGMLSARQATVAVQECLATSPTKEALQGAEVWLNELIWREFYLAILYHYPRVLKGSFRPVYDRIFWRNNENHFRAWCEGRTGYPVVDAALRQLSQSGWMHNRARMIAASFLVKDLLVDWRWGERWFMQHLVDGDPAANNGGWQWTAGTGTDAAPYFRIFNPVLQGKKFDPQGDYVRRWVAELDRVPKKYIQEPWKMPDTAQQKAGCIIGDDYPFPITDHREARQATLEAYAQAREERALGDNHEDKSRA